MNYDPLTEITMPDLTEALAKPEETEETEERKEEKKRRRKGK